jgi:hypothetical protein
MFLLNIPFSVASNESDTYRGEIVSHVGSEIVSCGVSVAGGSSSQPTARTPNNTIAKNKILVFMMVFIFNYFRLPFPS